MLNPNNKTHVIRSVMKAIYNLSDEENYSVYDAEDIASYLGLKQKIVDETIAILWDAGFLAECMTREDDGAATYCLTDRAIDLVEMG
jgi:DNA-binding MarR family transcriptional regulator